MLSLVVTRNHVGGVRPSRSWVTGEQHGARRSAAHWHQSEIRCGWLSSMHTISVPREKFGPRDGPVGNLCNVLLLYIKYSAQERTLLGRRACRVLMQVHARPTVSILNYPVIDKIYIGTNTIYLPPQSALCHPVQSLSGSHLKKSQIWSRRERERALIMPLGKVTKSDVCRLVSMQLALIKPVQSHLDVKAQSSITVLYMAREAAMMLRSTQCSRQHGEKGKTRPEQRVMAGGSS